MECQIIKGGQLKKVAFSILMTLGGIIYANDTGYYLDLSPVYLKYDSKGVSSSFKTTGMKLSVGHKIKKFSFVNLLLEGLVIVGSSDSKQSITNNYGTFTNAKVTVDQIYSLHLKNEFYLTDNISLNLYVGETRAKVYSSSDQSKSKRAFENSFSYGTGIEYKLNKQVSIHA